MMKSMNKVTENYKIIATCHPDMTQCTPVLMYIIVKTLQSNIKASCCDCSVAFHDNLTPFLFLLFLLTPDFLEESGYFILYSSSSFSLFFNLSWIIFSDLGLFVHNFKCQRNTRATCSCSLGIFWSWTMEKRAS